MCAQHIAKALERARVNGTVLTASIPRIAASGTAVVFARMQAGLPLANSWAQILPGERDRYHIAKVSFPGFDTRWV